jgi:DHA1 family 2-module integral membrane pump EmrD-like MFS transporter
MAWFSALLPQTGQFSLGMLMTAMGVMILFCWLPLAHKFQQHGETA